MKSRPLVEGGIFEKRVGEEDFGGRDCSTVSIEPGAGAESAEVLAG